MLERKRQPSPSSRFFGQLSSSISTLLPFRSPGPRKKILPPFLPLSLSLSLSLFFPPPPPCKRLAVLLLRRVGDVEREWECCTYGTTKEALLLLISSWQARIVERTSPLPSPECFPTSNVISCSARGKKLKRRLHSNSSLHQHCRRLPPHYACRWTCRRRSCTA